MSRRVFSLSFLLVTLVGASALAEEPPEPADGGFLEQVSVTASHTPIPVGETGDSITILTREDIERRGYVFLADLLRGIPGLSVSRSGPAGSLTQLRARGAEANHVLVRIDGVDVNDGFAGDEAPLELLRVDDVERVEFVRGPQSGLWGSDAVAGVLNLVTRSATETTGSSGEIEGGSFASTRAAGRIATAGDRWRLSAGASRFDTDGTNVSRQGNEADGAENTTADAGLAWTPSRGDLEIDARVRHTDAANDFDDIDFLVDGLPTDADNTTETRLTVARIGAAWSPRGDPRWSHRAAVSSTRSETETFLSGSFDGSSAIDKRGISLQSSVALGHRRGGAQRLTVAAEHERREFEQRGTASPFGDPNQDQRLDTAGLAVEYRLRHGRWTAAAAVRHDGNSDFDDVTTYRVSGSALLPGGRTRLRAAAGSGHKAPTFIERFGFFPGTFIGNPDLQPERSNSWEIGLDRSVGEHGSLFATYFDARLEDEINGFFFDPLAGGFTAVNDAGRSDRRGIEAGFSSPLGRRFDLAAAYTYTDADEPDGAGGRRRELRRPQNAARVDLGWSGSGGTWRVWTGLDHTGSQTDLWFPPFPQPAQRVRLDAYLLADVAISCRVSSRWTVAGRVENLLDERYENVYGFRNPGLAAYVGLRFENFNP